MHPIEGWENFYVIVGSSAGALIGLQFVVVTLLADSVVARGDTQAGGAFATPSVVHFGVVLLLSAIISAPWDGIGAVAVLWALMGLWGSVYSVVVARRLRAPNVYRPVLEDWLFHAILPLTSYLALAIAGAMAGSHTRAALFLVGAAAVLLLFAGIHNAWDAVTYHIFVQKQAPPKPSPSVSPKA